MKRSAKLIALAVSCLSVGLALAAAPQPESSAPLLVQRTAKKTLPSADAVIQESGAATRQRTTSKLDSRLAARVQATADSTVIVDAVSDELRQSDDNEIQVYVRLQPTGQISAETLAALTAAGLRIQLTNKLLGIVQGWISPEKINELTAVPAVQRITMPDYGGTSAGSVKTQGDSLLGSAQLRAAGLSGANVRIGVISDGVESLAVARASGDVPASVTVLQSCKANRPDDGVCDEGTAMLEIIHDMAPGATLGFCGGTAGAPTTLEFISCAERLRGPEFLADIIVDDIGFYTEPMMEDGPVARFVEQLVDQGLIWVSSAGNNGGIERRQFYSSLYVPASSAGVPAVNGRPKLYDSVNDFGLASTSTLPQPVSDIGNPLRVEAGRKIRVVLQWDDPYLSASNDYDLFLYDSGSKRILASSTEVQGGGVVPVESLLWENTLSTAQTVEVIVARVSGAQTRRIKIYACFLSSQACNLFYGNNDGQIYGHPAISKVIAVGAIDQADPGLDTLEDFSSLGPVRLFQPEYEERRKPDVVAVDRVSVSGAGGFPDRFIGTSAAAPHVAAILAQLLGQHPTADVRAALLASAVDLGVPGPDNASGYGRVDALAAGLYLERNPGSVNGDPSDDEGAKVKAGAIDRWILLLAVLAFFRLASTWRGRRHTQ